MHLISLTPSHHCVSSARCSRTRRMFGHTCPTLFVLPIPLCIGLLSPRSVGQWDTSEQMPLHVSQIRREMPSPWSLGLCICGETPVPDEWHSWHADKADLFVLLFFRQVVRGHLPMRAYLVQFQVRSSLMDLFFTSNETFRVVAEGIGCVSLPLHALRNQAGNKHCLHHVGRVCSACTDG